VSRLKLLPSVAPGLLRAGADAYACSSDDRSRSHGHGTANCDTNPNHRPIPYSNHDIDRDADVNFRAITHDPSVPKKTDPVRSRAPRAH
jgi:hypothetical protein